VVVTSAMERKKGGTGNLVEILLRKKPRNMRICLQSRRKEGLG